MNKHLFTLDRIVTVLFCQRNRTKPVLVTIIAAALCISQSAVADNFVWKGAPSIFNSWNDQNNWMNSTPGGTDSDGIPDGDDTATFNTNAITDGGAALNLSIGSSATLSITSGAVTVGPGLSATNTS
jgi:hypothetical protein